MLTRRALLTLGLFLVVVVLMGCASAPSYPTKPIEFVVHSSAGGGNDIMARYISDIFSREKIVPQTVTVVNKSGGSGAVASAYLGEKKGDAYTLYAITSVQIATPLQKGEGVTVQDLTPVANLVFDSNAIVVRADSSYKTLQDLIDASKKKPLSQGGGSITSTENIGGFLIKKATGAQWEFVSFNSGGEALTALLGGNVDFANPSPAEVTEQVRAGKVRVLAVNSEKRLDIWPDVPTLKELNLPYPKGLQRGILMPKDVPADAIKYWESALSKMRGTEAWKKYLKDNALIDAWMGADEFKAYLAATAKDFDTYMSEMGLKKK